MVFHYKIVSAIYNKDKVELIYFDKRYEKENKSHGNM